MATPVNPALGELRLAPESSQDWHGHDVAERIAYEIETNEPEDAGQVATVRESEAYRIGYLLQMQRLEDGARPETMQEAMKMAVDAAAMAPDSQLIERMSARKPGYEITLNADFQRDMAEGQNDAALDWVGEYKNKLEMADSLTAWTKTQDTSKFEIAEVAMARSLVRQMVDGSTEIDLTQKYATDMDGPAQNRHNIAIKNLAEHIQRATELGFSVIPGKALAQGFKISEVLAVSERIKV